MRAVEMFLGTPEDLKIGDMLFADGKFQPITAIHIPPRTCGYTPTTTVELQVDPITHRGVICHFEKNYNILFMRPP